MGIVCTEDGQYVDTYNVKGAQSDDELLDAIEQSIGPIDFEKDIIYFEVEGIAIGDDIPEWDTYTKVGNR